METENRVWQPRGRIDRDLEDGGAPERRRFSPETYDAITSRKTEPATPALDEVAYILERLSHWDHRDAAKWLLHVRATNRKRAAAKDLIDLLQENGLRDAIEEMDARR